MREWWHHKTEQQNRTVWEAATATLQVSDYILYYYHLNSSNGYIEIQISFFRAGIYNEVQKN